MADKNKRAFINISVFLILIITFVTYYSSLNYEITNWDDKDYVTDNIHIKELSLNNIQHIFSIFYVGNYHPVVLLVYSVLYHLFGLNPFGYHLFNILFHLVNCILVFLLTYKLTNKILIAFIVGLLFSIHPLHIESVTWISGTKDILYTLFYLGASISYLNYINKSFNKKLYILSLILFIISCLSKAMAVTLPIVLLLFDYILNRKINIKIFIEKIPFFIISLIIGIIAIYAQSDVYAIKDFTSYSWIEKLLIAFWGILFYIYKMIIPLNLSAIYPYPNNSSEFYQFKFLISPILVITLFVLLYYSRKYSKIIIGGFLFYLVNIFLILQIIPVGGVIAADRYFYLSSIGLFLIIAYFINSAYKNLKNFKTAIIAISLILIIVLSSINYKRTKVWENSFTLYNSIIKTYPNSSGIAIAYNNLGILKSNSQNYTDAVKDYNNAIKLNPNYDIAFFNRGLARNYLRDYKGAISDFDLCEKFKPRYFDLYYSRGISKYNINDYQGAINDYNQSISRNQNNPKAYYNRGIAKFSNKDYEGAINDYSKTISLQPNNGNAYNNRGYVKSFLKKYTDALNDYNLAIKYMPENAFAYNNRGFVKAKLNNFKDAIQDCNKSLSIYPNNAEAHFSLGYIYFNIKDFKTAVNEFNNAIRINPDHGESYFYIGNIDFFEKNIPDACKNWKSALDKGYTDADSIFKCNCKK